MEKVQKAFLEKGVFVSPVTVHKCFGREEESMEAKDHEDVPVDEYRDIY